MKDEKTQGVVPKVVKQPPTVGVVKKLPISPKTKMTTIVIGVAVILLGVGSGWIFAGKGSSNSKASTNVRVADETSVSQDGVDESLFPDTAEGELKEGGLNGEGTHYLDRGLGEEKNVALLSTVLNLDNYIGKKIEIWGNSVTSPQVGWLMDVGKVKILE